MSVVKSMETPEVPWPRPLKLQVEQGKKEGRKGRDVYHRSLEKGGIKLQCALCSLEEQRDKVSIPAWVASTYCSWSLWPRQRENMEVWQMWSSSRHCQAENRVMEIDFLSLHYQRLPPNTLQDLAVGHRGNCSIECRDTEQESAALRTEEITSEWQIHTVASPSDRSGDTPT